MYSYDKVGGSLSFKWTELLSVADADCKSAGRLMASTALLKNFIFIKAFGFSAGRLLPTSLNNL